MASALSVHRRLRAAVGIAALAAIVFDATAVVVREGEAVLVTRLGRPLRAATPSGLHWKLPWPIDRASLLDMRQRVYETGHTEMGSPLSFSSCTLQLSRARPRPDTWARGAQVRYLLPKRPTCMPTRVMVRPSNVARVARAATTSETRRPWRTSAPMQPSMPGAQKRSTPIPGPVAAL